jgi:hypothetical protein
VKLRRSGGRGAARLHERAVHGEEGSEVYDITQVQAPTGSSRLGSCSSTQSSSESPAC